MRGFLLDLNRCTGCHACQLACTIENGLEAGESWRRIYSHNPRLRPGVSNFHLSIGCLHCADPACMRCCPASAYSRDPDTGAILLDSGLCIGCRYCFWACPFDAPHYSSRAGTMSKCTFCNERLREGKDPACASLCPTGALQTAEMPESRPWEPLPGLPDTSISPSLRIVPLRAGDRGPDTPAAVESLPGLEEAPGEDLAPPPKAGIESEWSLIFFSVSAALLVAIVADAITGTTRIQALDFIMAALGTMAVSALHLGHRRRAWRAVLNLRTSWLSREVVLYTVFLLFSGLMFLSPALSQLFAWPAALAGFGALYCIDQVYESVGGTLWARLHSARVLLTGLFLYGILSVSAPVAGIAGMAKLTLYAYRQPWFRSGTRALASAIRLVTGFVVPLAIWNVYPEWMLPSVLIAEVVDRCEYYLDLEIIGIRQPRDPQ